ncbi:uncharacterized protein [Nicotiana tomentosiformis]|uniref:uncharacterized protein n=1 Tax=Nicotiana tomentosiformis TaxID=4098 RepID=UPI00388C4677
MSVSTSISTRIPLPTFVKTRSLLFLHDAQLSSISRPSIDNSTTLCAAKQQSFSSNGLGRGRHNNGGRNFNGGRGRGRHNQGFSKSFNLAPQQFSALPRLPSILGPPPFFWSSFVISLSNYSWNYFLSTLLSARDRPLLGSKAFVSDFHFSPFFSSHASLGDASWFVDSGAQYFKRHFRGESWGEAHQECPEEMVWGESLKRRTPSNSGRMPNNSCSIEFDHFGLSIEEFPTKKLLYQCNSSGPLYTLSSPFGGLVDALHSAFASARTSPNF